MDTKVGKDGIVSSTKGDEPTASPIDTSNEVRPGLQVLENPTSTPETTTTPITPTVVEPTTPTEPVLEVMKPTDPVVVDTTTPELATPSLPEKIPETERVGLPSSDLAGIVQEPTMQVTEQPVGPGLPEEKALKEAPIPGQDPVPGPIPEKIPETERVGLPSSDLAKIVQEPTMQVTEQPVGPGLPEEKALKEAPISGQDPVPGPIPEKIPETERVGLPSSDLAEIVQEPTMQVTEQPVELTTTAPVEPSESGLPEEKALKEAPTEQDPVPGPIPESKPETVKRDHEWQQFEDIDASTDKTSTETTPKPDVLAPTELDKPVVVEPSTPTEKPVLEVTTETTKEPHAKHKKEELDRTKGKTITTGGWVRDKITGELKRDNKVIVQGLSDTHLHKHTSTSKASSENSTPTSVKGAAGSEGTVKRNKKKK